MGKRLLLFLLLIMAAGSFTALHGQPVLAQSNRPVVLIMTADGPLTPAMVEYLSRGIRSAENQGAELIIFQLNTPGGGIDLMNQMVTDIRNSSVPVVVYVAPNGAMAGSAGSVITVAGQAAAMAPETAIGAASPVGSGGQDLNQTEALKQKEILKATMRSLAAGRGTQAVTLAQDMIENAKAVSAKEALSAGLVDFIASDTNDLLRQLNGFKVQVGGQERTLNTENAEVTPLSPTFIERLLGALTDPNLVLILLNIGVAAILIEIANPGGWIAGFTGVVCLALATYGLGVIPVNWFGIVFLVLAFVLFILDIKAPTHGALTAAGVGSLIIGALVLFNTPNVPGFQRVSIPVTVGSSMITGGLFFTILLFALRAQKTPLRTGLERLVGRVGTVTSDLSPRGQVQLGGEAWSAEVADSEENLPRGARVIVVKVEGLRLLVRKAVE